MKAIHAIRRFLSTSWLVAAPLVVVVLLVVFVGLLGIIDTIIGYFFGADAADTFLADTMVSLSIAIEIALIGLIAYGLFRLARRLLRKKGP